MTEGGNSMGAMDLIFKARSGSLDITLEWLKERGCPTDPKASGLWWDENYDTIKGQMQMKNWLNYE